MNRLLLIAYEPALFGLAVLGWAGWELWSLRRERGPREPPPEAGSDPAVKPATPTTTETHTRRGIR